MTREDFFNLEHLNVHENFIGVAITDKGYFLTTFKEGDDILTFESTTMIVFAVDTNVFSDFRVIDANLNEQYIKKREEALKVA